MKKLISFLSVIILTLGMVGCSEEVKKDDSKVNVVVSIYPLEEFTRMIGGDKVEITTLVKSGQEPHDFDFKPGDMNTLMKSDIFVYNGLGLESWLDDVKASVKDSNVIMVDSSKGVNSIKDGDKVDPHVWLSLKEAEIQAKNIKDALIQKDEKNKEYYEENYKKLTEEFNKMYDEYKPKFEKLKNKDFVTNHAAFGYLCREFGLNQKAMLGIYSAEGEVSPQTLKSLIEYCKTNNIKTIFSEHSAEQKNAETLARDAGTKVEKLYTLESKEDNKTYLDAMKYNLETIYKNLVLENNN